MSTSIARADSTLTDDEIAGWLRDAGCDLVHLTAYAADWPRAWYERLGFVDVGARWVAHRRG